MGAAALAAEAVLARLGRRADAFGPAIPTAARGREAAAPGRLVAQSLEEVLVLLDEGGSRGRVLERRAVRWFCALETPDRRG